MQVDVAEKSFISTKESARKHLLDREGGVVTQLAHFSKEQGVQRLVLIQLVEVLQRYLQVRR